MRQLRSYGSVGASGLKRPVSTRTFKFTAANKQSKHRAEDRPQPSAHGLFEAPSPSSPKRAGGVMSLSGHVLHLSNIVFPFIQTVNFLGHHFRNRHQYGFQ